MSFNIQCPHCGTPLEVEDEWAGMECECPQCRQKMMIPKPAAEPPRATPQIQPPPYPRSTPPVNPPPRQPGYWQNTQSGNPPPPPQSNYSISYDSEESSGSDWSFGGKILKYIIVAALALGWFFLQDKLGCSESTESSARSVVTKILAENDDIPAEFRHVKCKEVKLGGEISRQEFPELGVHVLGGTCYRGVATLDNGEKLKILIAKSSKEIYVRTFKESSVSSKDIVITNTGFKP